MPDESRARNLAAPVPVKPPEQTLAELAVQCYEDSKRYFGDSDVVDNLGHHVLSLCGEAGELANLVKKLERGSLDPKDASVQWDLRMETVDVLIYLLNVAALLRLDLYQGYMHKRAINHARFDKQRAEREGKNGKRSSQVG